MAPLRRRPKQLDAAPQLFEAGGRGGAGGLVLSGDRGPDPRPFAARLPRLDVLLDTSGEQDAELARELARLGHGRLRRVGGYTDVAPALGAIFTS